MTKYFLLTCIMVLMNQYTHAQRVDTARYIIKPGILRTELHGDSLYFVPISGTGEKFISHLDSTSTRPSGMTITDYAGRRKSCHDTGEGKWCYHYILRMTTLFDSMYDEYVVFPKGYKPVWKKDRVQGMMSFRKDGVIIDEWLSREKVYAEIFDYKGKKVYAYHTDRPFLLPLNEEKARKLMRKLCRIDRVHPYTLTIKDASGKIKRKYIDIYVRKI